MPELIKKYDATNLPDTGVAESAYAKSFPKSENRSDTNTAAGSGISTNTTTDTGTTVTNPAVSNSVNGQNA